MDILFKEANFGAIQGPVFALGSVLVNLMVWMILVVIGAFIDMKNEVKTRESVTPIVNCMWTQSNDKKYVIHMSLISQKLVINKGL